MYIYVYIYICILYIYIHLWSYMIIYAHQVPYTVYREWLQCNKSFRDIISHHEEMTAGWHWAISRFFAVKQPFQIDLRRGCHRSANPLYRLQIATMMILGDPWKCVGFLVFTHPVVGKTRLHWHKKALHHCSVISQWWSMIRCCAMSCDRIQKP